MGKEEENQRSGERRARRFKEEFGNTNSKDIWQNELLCAQFLRGYVKVPLLADVQPEDIEDITEELRPFVGVEYEGDSVKQIHLRGEKDRDIFVIGLLEHKSDVDYDVTFQLLKYMVGIWTRHRNRMNKGKSDSSRLKDFRYPLIIPVVYYEGKKTWTAAMHWKERVEFSDILEKYVPDFTYELIGLQNYSNKELLSREEELSLVMMLNRVQAVEDLDFANWSEEQRAVIHKIMHSAPQDVLRILAQMVYHFGLKLNLPDERVRESVKNVEDREMGELWANMDEINIPELKRQLQEEAEQVRKEAEQQCRKAEQVRKEAEQQCKEAEQVRKEAEQQRKKADEQIEEIKRESQGIIDAQIREIADLKAEIERLKATP